MLYFFTDESVNNSIDLWNVLDVEKSPKIKTPSLDLTEYQITNLTFDNAEEMKEKVYHCNTRVQIMLHQIIIIIFIYRSQ